MAEKNAEERALDLLKAMERLSELMDSQPSAKDLDQCDLFLRELGSRYARVAELHGKAKALWAEAVANIIQFTPEEEYKRFKNSSTLVEEIAAAQYPMVCRLMHGCESSLNLFKVVSDNYRTLISAFKQEREYSTRNQV